MSLQARLPHSPPSRSSPAPPRLRLHPLRSPQPRHHASARRARRAILLREGHRARCADDPHPRPRRAAAPSGTTSSCTTRGATKCTSSPSPASAASPATRRDDARLGSRRWLDYIRQVGLCTGLSSSATASAASLAFALAERGARARRGRGGGRTASPFFRMPYGTPPRRPGVWPARARQLAPSDHPAGPSRTSSAPRTAAPPPRRWFTDPARGRTGSPRGARPRIRTTVGSVMGELMSTDLRARRRGVSGAPVLLLASAKDAQTP